MKKLAFISLFLVSLLSACVQGNGCPDDMEECRLQDGTKICVPKGKC